jgi:hypothetical protein
MASFTFEANNILRYHCVKQALHTLFKHKFAAHGKGRLEDRVGSYGGNSVFVGRYLTLVFSRKAELPARLVIRVRTVSGSEFN